MLAPAGTDGMVAYVTPMTVREIGITLILHQTVLWRGHAGIVKIMARRKSGT